MSKENVSNGSKLKEAKKLAREISKRIKTQAKEIKGIGKRRKFIKSCSSDYDEVYRLYGRAVYFAAVSHDNRDRNKKKKIREGDYEAFLDIFGEREFRKYLDRIVWDDVKTESKTLGQRISGWFRYVFPLKSVKSVKMLTRGAVPLTLATIAAPAVLLSGMSQATQSAEKKSHKEQIVEYLDDVDAYGQELRKYDLSTIQCMMKIGYDMWERIDGYGDPETNLVSYPGMDVSKLLGVGVCRNMADDCARRLNAVDKRYNARIISVAAYNGQAIRANLPIREATHQEERKNRNDDKEERVNGVRVNVDGEPILEISTDPIKEFIDEHSEVMIGNHAVVLLDDVENDVTLVFDPTNALVGLYYNGQIEIFNSAGKEKPIVMTSTAYGEYVFGGLEKGVIERRDNIFGSFGIYSEEKMKKLHELYDVDAQNKAIEEVRNIRNYSLRDEYLNSLRIGNRDVSEIVSESKKIAKENDIEKANEKKDENQELDNSNEFEK